MSTGDSNDDIAPTNLLMSKTSNGSMMKKIKYQQHNKPFCFVYSFASALYHIGCAFVANKLANIANHFAGLPMVDQLKGLCNYARQNIKGIHCLPKKLNLKNATIESFLEHCEQDTVLTIVIPEGNDGSISHAFAVYDKLIFDSTQEYPLKCCKETVNWICGKDGCKKIFMSQSFVLKN